ncbi:sugar transporter SWEET1 [Diabrotica virgifera virgifera]|uniref:Sugar transporter SWEET n=1 Tax=Diabrotica virgifera virgifera TaxID=50390 RepID=A0A6P7GBU5_DIAVI|nr:sugar transporter SWEET1 [Diabrotica virgifera virgifera]
MEALSNILQPYKNVVGQTASIVTIAQFFSGAFICKDIYKKKSTAGIQAVPFIGGITIGILMLKLALLMNDAAMLQVNVAAIGLNVLYLAFYYYYSADKYNEVLKPGSVGVAIVAVFIGYSLVEAPELLEYRYSLVVTILMLALIGAPLLDVKAIIDKRDASSIPFPLTFMGTIVTALWLIYGIILQNAFMIVQNVIGFLLCLVQLVLIFKYPGPSGQTKNKAKSKKKSAKRD